MSFTKRIVITGAAAPKSTSSLSSLLIFAKAIFSGDVNDCDVGRPVRQGKIDEPLRPGATNRGEFRYRVRIRPAADRRRRLAGAALRRHASRRRRAKSP